MLRNEQGLQEEVAIKLIRNPKMTKLEEFIDIYNNFCQLFG